MITLEELVQQVWETADILKKNIRLINYKTYILRLLLYKRLSDLFEEELEKTKQKKGIYNLNFISTNKHCFLIPEGSRWPDIQRLKNNIGDKLARALADIEWANPKLRGVFTNTSDWKQINDGILLDLIQGFSKLNLQNSNLAQPNLLGEACEDLIERFALYGGKIDGVSTTPRQVAKLMVRLIEPQEEMHVCDPVCGTGGLLVEYANQIEASKDSLDNITLYGQALDEEAWITTKINLLLHNIFSSDIRLGDIPYDPQLLQEGGDIMPFDRVITNPPFGLKSLDIKEIVRLNRKNRFYYGTPPKSNRDYAFIQDIIASLTPTGRAAMIVSHGALSRGGAEAQIRRGIVSDDLIEAVIGLAPNLFFGTSVSAAILVLNRDKPKDRQGKILLIDASCDYLAGKKQNHLRNEDIEYIVSKYRNFRGREGNAKVVSCGELAANDYNLSIEHHVTSPKLKFDLQEEISKLSELKDKLSELKAERARIESEMNECLRILDTKI